ncbi:MAG: hypothetical protein RIS76_1662 [Verrucomicrobiota bacterium]
MDSAALALLAIVVLVGFLGILAVPGRLRAALARWGTAWHWSWTCLFVLIQIQVLRSKGWPPLSAAWMNYLAVGGLGLIAILTFFTWIRRRFSPEYRAARRRELDALSGPPSLHRQWALILLPVLGLAVGGLMALSRNQAAVEADARERAVGIARDLATRLSRVLPSEISFMELAGSVWAGDGIIGPPGVRWVVQRSPEPDPAAARWGTPEWVQGRYAMRPQEYLPLQLRFAADGSLVDPPTFPEVPVPPRWRRELSVGEVEQWERTRWPTEGAPPAAEGGRGLGALTQATADPDLRAFLRMQESLSGLRSAAVRAGTPLQASDLIAVATNAVSERVETESGVPLAVALFAEARRLDPAASLDPDWLEALNGMVLRQPSVFTPWVLEQAQLMVADPAALTGRRVLSELKAHWESDQRRRLLARVLTQRVPLSPPVLTNAWFTNGAAAWFAVIQPSVSWTLTFSNNVQVIYTNQNTSVRILSAEVLGQVLVRAVEAGPVVDGREQRLPPPLSAGMRLAFAVQGRPLESVPASWAGTLGEKVSVLASAEGEFLQEAQSNEGRFDNWPSRPRFTVRVLLADPAALFAAQRRQQWLFGGMILATAGVAGLGIWQANRAFARQLALNEQQSNFVSSVSHELRAPLASMRLLAEGLSSGRVTGEDKRREYAGFLVQETRRLGALVENVLDFARLKQGRQRYEFEPTDVVRWITETCRLMEPLAGEQRVRIVCEAPQSAGEGEGFAAYWDGRALQQALINLIDNALKHSPEGSTVRVQLEPVGTPTTAFRIRVADEGPGIPREDHERIFERFHRRGSELRRETQGIGLGLTIVRHAVEAHGGRVWVESELGQGATFVMEVPKGAEEALSGGQ